MSISVTTTTTTTQIKVRIFWSEANDSRVVDRCHRQLMSLGEDFSFAQLDSEWTTSNFAGLSHEEMMNEVYKMQGNNTTGEKLFDCQYTLSIGDVIEIEEDTKESQDAFTAPDCTAYIVSRIGFVRIQKNEYDANFELWRNSTCHERIMRGRKLSLGN